MSTDTLAPPSRLLTPPQVAELTGLAVGTLAKLRLRGEGASYIKLGAAVRYREEDVRRWLDSVPRRQSTADSPNGVGRSRGRSSRAVPARTRTERGNQA